MSSSAPAYRSYATTNEQVAYLLPSPPMTCNFPVLVELDGPGFVDCWPNENAKDRR